MGLVAPNAALRFLSRTGAEGVGILLSSTRGEDGKEVGGFCGVEAEAIALVFRDLAGDGEGGGTAAVAAAGSASAGSSGGSSPPGVRGNATFGFALSIWLGFLSRFFMGVLGVSFVSSSVDVGRGTLEVAVLASSSGTGVSSMGVDSGEMDGIRRGLASVRLRRFASTRLASSDMTSCEASSAVAGVRRAGEAT